MKQLVKKIIPSSQWCRLRYIYYAEKLRWREKIFCISMQRNATTSCGQFLKDHGFRVANYSVSNDLNWSRHWMDGNFEAIFSSKAFRSFQAFEDSPWWFPDFYKYLYHRFPTSRFILFYRDSNKWFESMLRHSNGRTLGNTYGHCKIYRRLDEYYDKVDRDPGFHPHVEGDDNLMSLHGKKDHYIQIYEEYNREVQEFFHRHDLSRLFTAELEDDGKWLKLGEFLDIHVEPGYNIHIRTPERRLNAVEGR